MSAPLRHFLGGLTQALSHGQARGDAASGQLRELYPQHPYLAHFVPPRFFMQDITCTVNYALDSIETEFGQDQPGNTGPIPDPIRASLSRRLPSLVRTLPSNPPLAGLFHAIVPLREVWAAREADTVAMLERELDSFSGRSLTGLAVMLAKAIMHELAEMAAGARQGSLRSRLGNYFGWDKPLGEQQQVDLLPALAKEIAADLGRTADLGALSHALNMHLTTEELARVPKELIQTVEIRTSSTGTKFTKGTAPGVAATDQAEAATAAAGATKPAG